MAKDSILSESINILSSLVNINTSSYNYKGISLCADYLCSLFATLNCEITHNFCKKDNSKLIAVTFTKNTKAPIQCLLSIHMDTVFEPTDNFLNYNQTSHTKATGPGVIDAKGGIVIAYNVLKWLDASEHSEQLGWTFIISTDEEIGSKDSQDLLTQASKNKDFALVFEPALENGNIVSSRPASANLKLTCVGKAAHAGRQFHIGINAITALTSFLESLKLNYYKEGVHIINIGKISGGTRENIVPDECMCELNVRFSQDKSLTKFCNLLQNKINHYNDLNDARIVLDIQSIRPAKPLNERSKSLYKLLNKAINKCNLNIQTEPSFGVCDGNFIAATGIPVIDTLGPCGTGMHTKNETIHLESLNERTSLTCELISLYLQEAQVQKNSNV